MIPAMEFPQSGFYFLCKGIMVFYPLICGYLLTSLESQKNDIDFISCLRLIFFFKQIKEYNWVDYQRAHSQAWTKWALKEPNAVIGGWRPSNILKVTVTAKTPTHHVCEVKKGIWGGSINGKIKLCKIKCKRYLW